MSTGMPRGSIPPAVRRGPDEPEPVPFANAESSVCFCFDEWTGWPVLRPIGGGDWSFRGEVTTHRAVLA